jgi:hypothetical protein
LDRRPESAGELGQSEKGYSGFWLTQYKIIDNEEFDPKGESEEADIFDKFIAREKKAPDSSVDDEYVYCNSQAVPRTPTNLVHEEAGTNGIV